MRKFCLWKRQRNGRKTDPASRSFYVYALVDPRNDEEFYYGKGTGDRCHHHVREWRSGRRDRRTNWEKLDRVGEIIDAGHEVGIRMLAEKLTERGALKVEFRLIRRAAQAGHAITNLFGTDTAGYRRRRLVYALKLVNAELHNHASREFFEAEIARMYGRLPTQRERWAWLRELTQLATVRQTIHAGLAAIKDLPDHARPSECQA